MGEIMNLIHSRKSSRGPFDPHRPVMRDDIDKILEAGVWAPTAHNMQNFEIVVVDDPGILEDLGKLRNPISMDFIKENLEQLSFSEAELKQRKTGVLASRFPPAWTKPDPTREELEAAYRPMPASPAMLFMLYDSRRRAPASEGDFLGSISLGCITENMWLAAESLGIGFHIMSSFGVGQVEKDVKRILNIPASLKIVYAIRLGYSEAPYIDYLRVRREVKDFTHYNSY